MTNEHRGDGYVPLSVRRSRLVSWLWGRGHLSYRQARSLARWLP